jgi:hypothetical protein
MHWTRRDWMRLAALGLGGHSLSGWLPALAEDSLRSPERKRSCILLWMPGGPSQIDTFDPKPGHPNGGEFKAIDTSIPGIRVCEHLPQLARQMEHVAIIPSMQTKEGDHQRAAYHLRTGYRPTGPVQYPAFGSLVSNELARSDLDLPGYVSILPPPSFGRIAYGPGFLGPSRAPLVVGSDAPPQDAASAPFGAPFSVRDIDLPKQVDLSEADTRLDLLRGMEERYAAMRVGLATNSHREAYRQAVQMMRSPAIKAFNLEEEPEALREKYGRNRFGQACLLARRLVEQGVPFIEIALSGLDGQQIFGWDTHGNNFSTVKSFCEVLDPAWATLVGDLRDRGLLDSTLIVWMGEFGRTPGINNSGGRDHYPNAWSTVLCGGGIRGGQTYGKTSADGNTVESNPVSVAQLLATVCGAVGIDHRKQNMSNVGRPIRIVEPETAPIGELLA